MLNIVPFRVRGRASITQEVLKTKDREKDDRCEAKYTGYESSRTGRSEQLAGVSGLRGFQRRIADAGDENRRPTCQAWCGSVGRKGLVALRQTDQVRVAAMVAAFIIDLGARIIGVFGPMGMIVDAHRMSVKRPGGPVSQNAEHQKNGGDAKAHSIAGTHTVKTARA